MQFVLVMIIEQYVNVLQDLNPIQLLMLSVLLSNLVIQILVIQLQFALLVLKIHQFANANLKQLVIHMKQAAFQKVHVYQQKTALKIRFVKIIDVLTPVKILVEKILFVKLSVVNQFANAFIALLHQLKDPGKDVLDRQLTVKHQQTVMMEFALTVNAKLFVDQFQTVQKVKNVLIVFVLFLVSLHINVNQIRLVTMEFALWAAEVVKTVQQTRHALIILAKIHALGKMFVASMQFVTV